MNMKMPFSSDGKRYYTWNRHLRGQFGEKIMKISLDAGFDFTGSNLVPKLNGLSPGQYVVNYTRITDIFQIEPLTEAMLDVEITQNKFHSVDHAFPAPLQVLVNNNGLGNAYGLIMVVEASNGENSLEIARQPLEVAGGDTFQRLIQLPVVGSGEWQVQVRIEDQEGSVVQTETAELGEAVEREPFNQVLSLSSDGYRRLPAFVLLGLLVVVVVLILRKF